MCEQRVCVGLSSVAHSGLRVWSIFCCRAQRLGESHLTHTQSHAQMQFAVAQCTEGQKQDQHVTSQAFTDEDTLSQCQSQKNKSRPLLCWPEINKLSKAKRRRAENHPFLFIYRADTGQVLN